MDITDDDDDPNDPKVRAQRIAQMKQEKEDMLLQAVKRFSIVLPEGLFQLLPAIDISRNAHEIVRQNRYIAFAAWVLLVPPAMGVLTAFGGPMLGPFGAFLGMVGATLLVLLNSLRMRNAYEPKKNYETPRR